MEAPTTTGPAPPTNPPSVEAAYKRKCIQLKKRLNDIEAENDAIRNRNKRSMAYVQKMRLESCILLERLAKVTGMMEEASTNGQGFNPELRARATAFMSNPAAATHDGGVGGEGGLDDETEGSSEERPPTVRNNESPTPDPLRFRKPLSDICFSSHWFLQPQERPLRIKRSRKSNIPAGEVDAADAEANNAGDGASGNDNGDGDLRTIITTAGGPSHDHLTSSFRVVNHRNGDDAATAPRSTDRVASSGPMDVDEKEPKVET